MQLCASISIIIWKYRAVYQSINHANTWLNEITDCTSASNLGNRLCVNLQDARRVGRHDLTAAAASVQPFFGNGDRGSLLNWIISWDSRGILRYRNWTSACMIGFLCYLCGAPIFFKRVLIELLATLGWIRRMEGCLNSIFNSDFAFYPGTFHNELKNFILHHCTTTVLSVRVFDI